MGQAAAIAEGSTEDRARNEGVLSAHEMSGRGVTKTRPDATAIVNRLDRVLFAALLVGLAVAAAVTIVRRTGNDPYVDVVVPAERAEVVRIDLNTAAWFDLLLLDGIGETLARRIVADRKANGPLASVDDLTRVSGIGPKTVDRIRARATVAGSSLSLEEGIVFEPPAPATDGF